MYPAMGRTTSESVGNPGGDGCRHFTLLDLRRWGLCTDSVCISPYSSRSCSLIQLSLAETLVEWSFLLR